MLTSVHEVAEELPAGRDLKELKTLLLSNAVQGRACGHAACHALLINTQRPSAAAILLCNWMILFMSLGTDTWATG